MIRIHAPKEPKKADLQNVYDICNRIFKSEQLFVKTEQLKDKKYIAVK